MEHRIDNKFSKILITGGCGFLGRHFIKRLVKECNQIVVIDDLSSGLEYERWPDFLQDKKITQKVKFIYKDICQELFNHSDKYDLVIHLASNIGGREVISNNFIINSNSLELDSLFLRWIVENKPSKTIYMSSSAIYPVNKQTSNIKLKESLIDFNSFSVPDLVYGWSKLTGEYLSYLYAKKYQLDIFCPRPFSGYGEDQDDCYPIPAICKRLINDNNILIWGSGDQKRDFIYVDDVIDAILEYLPFVKGYETMNIGSGIGTNFKQIVKLGSKILIKNCSIISDINKPEGVKFRVSNNKKMTRYYSLKISLKDGLKKCLNLMLKQL